MNWQKLEKLDSKNMKGNIESQGRSISLSIKNEIENLKKISEKMKRCNNFIFSGCGDKYIVPLISQYLWRQKSKKPLEVFHSKIISDYLPASIDKNSCIVFLSQSGKTVDVLNAFNVVRKRNPWIVCITNLKENEENSLLSFCRDYQKTFLVNTWTEIYPEEPLPSTATFHTSLTLLNLFVLLILEWDKAIDLQVNQIPKLVDALSRSDKVKDFAKKISLKIKKYENFYFVGDGPRYFVARKASRIMFMEGVKTNACDVEGEEFIHSLIEVVERKPNILFLLKPLEFWEKSMEIYEFIKNVWPKKLLIEIDPFEFLDVECKSIFASEEGNLLSPFLYIVPLEWISYYLALVKNVDPGEAKIVSKIRSGKNLQKIYNLKKTN
ncbi:MAG: SIS domain-containing protein [Candidatus Aenigmarchaeota archaeon]|nr:SIS domain-containing protein [Candidatus Aenigmarchaeota archaeon]